MRVIPPETEIPPPPIRLAYISYSNLVDSNFCIRIQWRGWFYRARLTWPK